MSALQGGPGLQTRIEQRYEKNDTSGRTAIALRSPCGRQLWHLGLKAQIDSSSLAVDAPGAIVPSGRRYVLRPELTNKTHEMHQAVRDELTNPRLADKPGAYRSRLPLSPDNLGSVSDHVQVRAYSPPNWFTAAGVNKKRRQIELRGLPSFFQWRFITLTIDPKPFEERGEGALHAYLAGKAKMAYFLDECRKCGLWKSTAKWAWKLEFHRNGWPHWHLLVSRTEKMSDAEIAKVKEVWHLGATDVEMVRDDCFIYSFKYAFKPVLQRDPVTDELQDDAVCVPDWFLDYSGQKLVKVIDPRDKSETYEFKPTTFAKVRFWQTSAGFYTGIKPSVVPSEKVQIAWVIPQPARVGFERVGSQVQIVSRKRSGRYAASGVFPVAGEAYDVWKAGSRAHTFGDGAALGPQDYFLPIRELTKQIDPTKKWKLMPLLQKNRLSLRHAMTLQRQGKHWKTS